MAKGVWIVAEQRDGVLRKISFELASAARNASIGDCLHHSPFAASVRRVRLRFEANRCDGHRCPHWDPSSRPDDLPCP